jgi:hypothetical protein
MNLGIVSPIHQIEVCGIKKGPISQMGLQDGKKTGIGFFSTPVVVRTRLFDMPGIDPNDTGMSNFVAC